MTDKPRVRFCWACGRKLCGNHFKELKIHGHKRILHKQCAKEYEPEPHNNFKNHLDLSKKAVSEWPEWKRKLLGRSNYDSMV